LKQPANNSSLKRLITDKYFIFGTLLVVALVTITTFLRTGDDTNNLTVPPERSLSKHEITQQASTFSLSIQAPLVDINKNINKLKVQQIKGIDDGPRECSEDREGKRSCYTTKYQYTISSGSPSIVPGVDNTINVSIPVYVSGRGTQIGRAENKPHSDIRYFQSKLVANANISISLDSKWCPRIKIEPDFLWKDRTKVEVFHRAKVDLQYLVEKRLRDPVINMGEKVVKDFVSCGKIRRLLSESWNQVSFPVNKPDSAIQQYISIKPESIGYAGLTLSSGKLHLDYRISAITEITDTKLDVEKRALPAAALAAEKSNIAYIPVPVNLSYKEILTGIYQQIGGEPFFTRNRFGEHNIKIKKITIYPSEGNLIIGLQIHMTNTEDWLDKSGWVHIITQPRLINTGDGIILSGAKYAEGTDPDEWVTIRRALNESIIETIEQRGLIISFNESGKHLLKAMVNELEKPRAEIPVLFKNPEFKISDISLLDDRLVINGAMGAEARFVPDAEFEMLAQNEEVTSQPDVPLDPALERIQTQMDNLLRQIDSIESKLDRFRQIINN